MVKKEDKLILIGGIILVIGIILEKTVSFDLVSFLGLGVVFSGIFLENFKKW